MTVMMQQQENALSIARKRTREIKQYNERNNLLDEQLSALHSENVNLRDKIAQLEEAISVARGPENVAVAAILKDIKDNLYGDTLKLSAEKRKRIILLKKLSQTKFKDSNEKHCALLNRLWQLHAISSKEEVNWTVIGFAVRYFFYFTLFL